jgi:signal transduction histidine kinase
MSFASASALSAALIVLYVASFHAWIYWQRREEREHLWLAVTASGIAGFGVTAAMLYSAHTVEEGIYWQRAMFLTSCPLLVGFLGFSHSFLGVERPLVVRVGLAFSGSVVLLAYASDLLLTGEPLVRRAPLFGLHWVESVISPLGRALMASYFVAFAYLIALYTRHARSGGREVRTLLVTLCLWCAAGASDAAVAMGVYDAPYSLAFGYLAIVVGFSGILIRRLLQARTELERLASRLEEDVETRSEELRRKELQLARGEQLATIGTLAASVAHEINNPIAFVHSNLNRLDEMWDKDEERDEVSEILDECREGTERVRGIVSDLLRLSRSGDVRTEPVDLHETIAKALPLARGPARRRARLSTRLAGVPRVLGDERLLGQVVLNLVMNALQAIPEGTPETNQVSVSTSSEGGGVRLVVADTGPGIPEELRERIFDPFYTTKNEGTGLGLAVTRDIITRHQGSIEVHSTSSGTQMIIDFPAHVLAEPESQSPG